MRKLLFIFLFLPFISKAQYLYTNTVYGFNNGIQLKEISTPTPNPPAGLNWVYFKSDHNLYKKNSSGIETCLTCTSPGTVTSVGITVPSLLSVSGSPVTTSGTLGITWNATPYRIPYFDDGGDLGTSPDWLFDYDGDGRIELTNNYYYHTEFSGDYSQVRANGFRAGTVGGSDIIDLSATTISYTSPSAGQLMIGKTDGADVYSIYLPASQGSANTYLKNDGSGNLTWATVAGGVPTLTEHQIGYGDAGNLMTSSPDFTYNTLIELFDVKFGGNSFLTIDRANRLYQIGDIENTTSGLVFEVDDAARVYNFYNGGSSGDITFQIDRTGFISKYLNATPAEGDMLYGNPGGVGGYAVRTIGSNGQYLTSDGTAPQWTSLDAELAALAGLTSAADKLPYFTGSGTAAVADFTAYARTLLDDANAATARATLGSTTVGDQIYVLATPGTTGYLRVKSDGTVNIQSPSSVRTDLGLVIGTDVQAYDADLTTWAGITPAANVGTFLATPSSANLRAGMTDENGTGAALFSGATSPTFAGTTAMASATFTGTVTNYNNIATANNGLAASVGTPVHLTGQTAAIAATTCYTADADGWYQVCWQATITTAATTSSVLGNFQVKYTNVADNVVKTTATNITNVTRSLDNTTGTTLQGVYPVYAKSGTAIQYVMGYTSVGGTPMAFSLDISVVKL